MKPYHTWKQEFIQDRRWPHGLCCTSGYGTIHPTTDRGKLCCLLYCVIGIPLVFLVLTNNGQFVVDIYVIIRKSLGNKTAHVHYYRKTVYIYRKSAAIYRLNVNYRLRHNAFQTTASEGLPLWLSFVLLLLHSVVGGLLFSTWMGQMRFFDAVYCRFELVFGMPVRRSFSFSFISVSTIGYGDLVPVPDTWTHSVVIISFLSAGVIILSTFFQTFGYYLQYLHHIGRRFTGTKDVEIWFGGRILTVQELITLVAKEFGVSPQRLRTLLRDLDNILEAACDDATRIMMLRDEKCPMLVSSELKTDDDVERTPGYRIPSKSSMQLIVRDTENVVQALRIIHHKLNKVPFRQHQLE
uniref:Ion_trans_2 domain-containing protein n=1 Tax=Angiostrongylus cantonensis TaxID=6313 RepID=A0A0K0D0W1_ANGCA